MNTNPKNILLGVTASISAYKVCDLITELRAENYSVTAVMTEDAHHFVTPLVLESFTANDVIENFFSVAGRKKPIHIELAKKSDVILIAPATADVIAKLSYGFAGDVLTCTVLATQAPVIIVPAMNDKMYSHPATQENIERLKKRGVIFVPPIEGHLVCSDQGMGHIADNATIRKAVHDALAKKN